MKKNFNTEEINELEKLNKELEECCKALSCEDLLFLIEYANKLLEEEKRNGISNCQHGNAS